MRPQAAVVISGKRRRHHFQFANASGRLHCDNVPKPLSRRLGACFSLHVRRATARVDLQET